VEHWWEEQGHSFELHGVVILAEQIDLCLYTEYSACTNGSLYKVQHPLYWEWCEILGNMF
jgi:hypothetical protein